jgi:hypothetical protein
MVALYTDGYLWPRIQNALGVTPPIAAAVSDRRLSHPVPTCQP